MKLAENNIEFILQSTSARRVVNVTQVQSLWSGYGQICRAELVGGTASSVIVKHVAPPGDSVHPRGWSGDRSHARKLKSYEVESRWYTQYIALCNTEADRELAQQDNFCCRIPHCYGTRQHNGEFLFVLEDLDAAGFSLRRHSLDRAGVLLGLECWHISTLDSLAPLQSDYGTSAPTGTSQLAPTNWLLWSLGPSKLLPG